MCRGRKKMWIFILIFPFLVAAYAAAFMLLWNWLMPEIAGLKEITFWQSLGILALSKLLFGFRGGWGKCHHHHPRHKWKHKMKEKFSHMSDEEKALFKAHWKERCGWKDWDGKKSDVQNTEETHSDK